MHVKGGNKLPPNQSPLASLFNFFKGSSQNASPRTPNSFGAFPRFDGNPGRINGYPGPGGGFGGNSGFGGYGGYPGAGRPPGFGNPGFGPPGGSAPGLGGSGSGGSSFGIGDLFKSLGKVDIGKVMNGVNNVRSLMSNAQKVATTLNQLGITVGNVQKFMKQVDVNGLMNLLGSNSEESSSPPEEEETSPKPSTSTKRKYKKKKKKKQPTYSRVRKKTTHSANRMNRGISKSNKTRTSKPLFKMPT